MAKQVIQLGSAVNDGTGDPLRTAFTKTNANFTELYTAVDTIPSLGSFKISENTLGTKAQSGNGWGGYWMYLDPAGEGSSGIAIPSSAAQTDGGSLQIYHNNIDSGPLQLTTNGGTWEFKQNGKLAGPAEGELELDSNLSMNTDKGFVVEMGRFPMAVSGDDWWFDVSINKNDGYVYCFGGADEADGGDGEPLIVKFDSYGNVVWQNTYTVPTNWGMPNIVTADFKDANTIVVVGMSNVYDSNTDSSIDYIVSFEVQTSNGNVVSNSGYALTATDTLENWTPYIWASQIRYNAGKTQYAIVGSTFGDVSNYTISTASAISTTPGVLKVSKSAIDTAFGTTGTPSTYSNAWTIRGYGFTSTNQFTESTVETIEETEYYVLTTDSDVDFTTLPEGESWIIRYYDTESAYITTGSWDKKIDYLGQQQWFNAVGFDSTGNIYAGGASGLYTNNVSETSLLVSLTSTGAVRWAKRLDNTAGPGYNNIKALTVDQTNNYIYTVAHDDDGGLVVAKVNTSGVVSWIKTITMDDGMSEQYNSRIVYCPVDNSIVIAMEYNSITSYNDDFLLMKLNTDGELQWALSFGSSGEENVNWEYGQDFLSADDNFIYVAGSRYTGDDDNATLFAIPHDGIESGWVGIYNVRNSTDNLTLTTGTTSNTSVAVTTTTLTNVSDDSYITLDGDSEYPTRRAYLNGGNNKVKNVAEVEFADGTTQRTSATDIPQIEVLSYGNEIRLHAGHRGGHIKVRADTDNHTIIVPTHAENPLPIGMVVTIVLDEASNDNIVYITGQDDGLNTVYIRPVGSDVYDNRYWSIGGDNVQGLYTLMKIEQNVWILSGATINNAD